MKKIPFAIHGFGTIAKTHIVALRTLPVIKKTPFVPVLDTLVTRNPDLHKEQAYAMGFDYVTNDICEAANRESVAAVSVCTPNAFHPESIRAAGEAGKSLYCEKPIADTYKQSVKAAAAFPDHLTEQVALMFRYHPAVQRTTELLHQQSIGEVLQCKISYLRSGYLDQERPFSWRVSSELSGGGAITDIGVHALDLVCHWFGELSHISGFTETFVKERHVEPGSGQKVNIAVDDWAAVNYETASGVRGMVEVSRIAWGSDAFTVQIVGTQGSIVMDLERDSYPKVQLLRGALSHCPEPAGLALLPDAKATMGLFVDSHFASLHHFMLRLNGSDEFAGLAPTFADALRVEKYVAQVREKE
ncbi:Gfo/Idh/MocA family protein [Paenibacillus fonticola]|uniref:Gfo/Idh/MocA family protein n=1 Tax=Paenibacillus fonticola TaxID=379896 RepID=UPI00037137AC|nr:Gfo/Idh/MocA family oxidoreductase [Paenibacillus fonticola]